MTTVLTITLDDAEVDDLHGYAGETGVSRLRQMAASAADPDGEGVEIYFRAYDETLTAAAVTVAEREE